MNELEIVSSLVRATVIHSTNIYCPSLITLLLWGEHVMKGYEFILHVYYPSSLHLGIHPPIYSFIHPSIHLSIYQFIHTYIQQQCAVPSTKHFQRHEMATWEQVLTEILVKM